MLHQAHRRLIKLVSINAQRFNFSIPQPPLLSLKCGHLSEKVVDKSIQKVNYQSTLEAFEWREFSVSPSVDLINHSICPLIM